MPLTDDDIAAELAPAGLVFIERVEGEIRLPLKPNRSAASSRPEDGRFGAYPDEIIDVDDPELATKLNAGWLRMATEFGLFDERREFLINVNYSEDTYEPERAVSESFNSVLEVEFVHRQSFATRAEARIRIATWIADFYNTRRRHSAAGGLPPAEFERIMKERRSTNDLQAAQAA